MQDPSPSRKHPKARSPYRAADVARIEERVMDALGLDLQASRGKAADVKRSIRDTFRVTDEAVRYARWQERYRPPESPSEPTASDLLAFLTAPDGNGCECVGLGHEWLREEMARG